MSDLVERLSDRVHQAWMAEKLSQGYADHPRAINEDGTGCCVAEKHHDDMLPYADLPEHIKEYDRVTVRTILAALKEEGSERAAREAAEAREARLRKALRTSLTDLLTAFVTHRTVTHEVKPKICLTCQESDAAIAAARAILEAPAPSAD